MLNIVVSCCIMNHVVSLLGVCFINLTSSLVLLKVIQPAGQQAYISHGYAKPGEVPQTSESQHQTIKWNRFWTFLNVFEIWSNHPGFASLNSFCGLWPSRPLICAFTAMRVANWLRVVWTCLNMFANLLEPSTSDVTVTWQLWHEVQMPQMGAQRVGTNLTQVTGPDAEEDDDPNRLPTFVKAHAQHRIAQNTLNTSVTETYSYRNNHIWKWTFENIWIYYKYIHIYT